MSNDEILSRLSKAGALVGISNAGWWSNLVSDYGEPCVLAIVDELKADTGQVVNVTAVASRCKDEAKRKQDEADDAAEDAAMARQISRTEGRQTCTIKREPSPTPIAARPDTATTPAPSAASERSTSKKSPAQVTTITASPVAPVVTATASTATTAEKIRKAAPAAAESISDKATECRDEVVSTPAAGDATPTAKAAAIKAPWGLTKPTNQGDDMATIKQLVKSVEDEIARRGIRASVALREIGVSQSALRDWRNGSFGPTAQEKAERWLTESAKKPAAADKPRAAKIARDITQHAAAQPAAGVTLGSSPALVIKTVAGRTASIELGSAPASIDGPAVDSLLTQATNLADALRALGATGYADVCTQLVARLRTVRAALSA